MCRVDSGNGERLGLRGSRSLPPRPSPLLCGQGRSWHFRGRCPGDLSRLLHLRAGSALV